jgi:hypothetical protein
MPDISMCSGEKCPLKENCYRFLATPNEFRQSYFMNPPYNDETKECNHFWDNYVYQKIKDENKIEH